MYTVDNSVIKKGTVPAIYFVLSYHIIFLNLYIISYNIVLNVCNFC